MKYTRRMMENVPTISRSIILFVLLLLPALTVVTGQTYLESSPHLTGQYHQEITYPTQQLDAYQHLARYTTVPTISVAFRRPVQYQSFPLNTGVANNDGLTLAQSASPAASLFTPNAVQQPVVSSGQLEEYRKALEEEARDAENADNKILTEQQQVDVGGVTGGYDDGVIAAAAVPRSYVSVKVQGVKHYNYGYTV